MNTLDIQARLMARGFDPGPIDGIEGDRTRAAMMRFRDQTRRSIHDDFHPSGLHRIILHWTAGSEGVIELERRHYHLIIGQDARVYAGDHAPEANADISDGRYAAHTRALNTGSIGVALDGMAGAVERPFNAGTAPITSRMVQALVETVADLCVTYDIPLSPWTVLTHAEVQPTLGVWQRAKWDICWLPGMVAAGDAVTIGGKIRDMIAAQMPERVAA